jgi:hypothetical protein
LVFITFASRLGGRLSMAVVLALMGGSRNLFVNECLFVRKAHGGRPWHVYINYILQAGYHTPINTT